MRGEILGYLDVTGNYQGREYHNYNFTVSYLPKNGYGTTCMIMKVSAKYLPNILEKNGITFDQLIGSVIESIEDDVFYDQFQKIKFIRFSN